MSDVLEKVFTELQNQINVERAEREKLTKRSEVAGTVQELRELTFADASASIPSVTGWAVAVITDGRKTGEGAGLGTGCVAYLDQGNGPVVWKRMSDDVAVAT